jgi:hypothetical protein
VRDARSVSESAPISPRISKEEAPHPSHPASPAARVSLNAPRTPDAARLKARLVAPRPVRHPAVCLSVRPSGKSVSIVSVSPWAIGNIVKPGHFASHQERVARMGCSRRRAPSQVRADHVHGIPNPLHFPKHLSHGMRTCEQQAFVEKVCLYG